MISDGDLTLDLTMIAKKIKKITSELNDLIEYLQGLSLEIDKRIKSDYE